MTWTVNVFGLTMQLITLCGVIHNARFDAEESSFTHIDSDGTVRRYAISEFNKKRPMQKIASIERIEARGTLRLPKDNVYKYAKLAKKAYDSFYRAQNALLEFSDDVVGHLKNDFLPAVGLSKRAAGLSSVLLTNAFINSMRRRVRYYRR